MERTLYPTDVTDDQRQLIEPWIAAAQPGGRPRHTWMREVVNALAYWVRRGCAWRLSPPDFPSWRTVYEYFRVWKKDGTLERLHSPAAGKCRMLREQVRTASGKEKTPSAAALGPAAGKRPSQSVRTAEKGGTRGYDAGKKIKGRKRPIVVDTLGMILALVVHPADVPDRDGARLVLARLGGLFPRLTKIRADGGYAGALIDWAKAFAGWLLEIVRRGDDGKGFVVLPKRWIVERTFGWLNRNRRLSKDCETLTGSSENMIYLAMINQWCIVETQGETTF